MNDNSDVLNNIRRKATNAGGIKTVDALRGFNNSQFLIEKRRAKDEETMRKYNERRGNYAKEPPTGPGRIEVEVEGQAGLENATGYWTLDGERIGRGSTLDVIFKGSRRYVRVKVIAIETLGGNVRYRVESNDGEVRILEPGLRAKWVQQETVRPVRGYRLTIGRDKFWHIFRADADLAIANTEAIGKELVERLKLSDEMYKLIDEEGDSE